MSKTCNGNYEEILLKLYEHLFEFYGCKIMQFFNNFCNDKYTGRPKTVLFSDFILRAGAVIRGK